jgi:O-antigen ligase
MDPAFSDTLSYADHPARRADSATTTSTASRAWRAAIVVLIAVIWLIPIRSYRLPVSLPFNLEPYRLVIIALLFALVVSVLIAGRRLDAGGHGLPVVLLAAAGVASLLAARQQIDQAGLQTQAIKSLSYLLSFVVAFVLIASVIRAFEDIVAIIAVIVVGAFAVAVAALVESRTHYNVFDHLQSALPFLKRDHSASTFFRQGRLRVHASSQHPIALGVALAMCTPLAIYLGRRARSKLWSRLWVGAALVIVTGAAVTQSRTVAVMLGGMVLLALWLRPRQVARWWPLAIVVVGFIHLASPHTLGNLYTAFKPSGGILAQQESRNGLGGSGRIADVRPGLHLWESAPIFGHGPGTEATSVGAAGPQAASPQATPARASAPQAAPPTTANSIIFDDQYMSSLVELGIVGFLAVVWLVIGSVVKMARVAKRVQGPVGDLLAAFATACAGFALSMVTFDAFSFVQVTLLFFVLAALGLQTRRLAVRRSETVPPTGGRS